METAEQSVLYEPECALDSKMQIRLEYLQRNKMREPVVVPKITPRGEIERPNATVARARSGLMSFVWCYCWYYTILVPYVKLIQLSVVS